MPVKCKCGHKLPDPVTRQKVNELKAKAYTNDLWKAIIDSVDSILGAGKGEDILNRLDYPCPSCGKLHQWIGYSEEG